LLAIIFLGDDVVAELDALVADVDGGPSDELTDLPLRLAAERAGEIDVVLLRLHRGSSGPVRGQCTTDAALRNSQDGVSSVASSKYRRAKSCLKACMGYRAPFRQEPS